MVERKIVRNGPKRSKTELAAVRRTPKRESGWRWDRLARRERVGASAEDELAGGRRNEDRASRSSGPSSARLREGSTQAITTTPTKRFRVRHSSECEAAGQHVQQEATQELASASVSSRCWLPWAESRQRKVTWQRPVNRHSVRLFYSPAVPIGLCHTGTTLVLGGAAVATLASFLRTQHPNRKTSATGERLATASQDPTLWSSARPPAGTTQSWNNSRGAGFSAPRSGVASHREQRIRRLSVSRSECCICKATGEQRGAAPALK